MKHFSELVIVIGLAMSTPTCVHAAGSWTIDLRPDAPTCRMPKAKLPKLGVDFENDMPTEIKSDFNAMARDFSNQVADRLRKNTYAKSGACVSIRFMGLWDTVAQFGVSGNENDEWELSVPGEVNNAFQAVALNEYRFAFPGESILGGDGWGVRVEMGFIGSHADIGGGYAEGDLSDISLNWIYLQAARLGIKMRRLAHADTVVANPVIHNKELPDSSPITTERTWRTRSSNGKIISEPTQKKAVIDGMSYQGSLDFISYYRGTTYVDPVDGIMKTISGAKKDAYGQPNIFGTVDIEKYSKWLEANYGLVIH